jgi:hypothetical protein
MMLRLRGEVHPLHQEVMKVHGEDQLEIQYTNSVYASHDEETVVHSNQTHRSSWKNSLIDCLLKAKRIPRKLLH